MSSSRDIERYAGLFASRTKVMKSSAMRDLMAVTARPEIISLAGGLPDTSTFPPETFAAVAQRIAPSRARRRSSTGPPRASRDEGLHRRGDGAEGMRVDPRTCSSRPAASR
jgi:2-aminoadipate transaminase